MKRRNVFFRHLLPVDVFLVGALDDFIVNVGEVADVVHFVADVLEVAVHGVEYDTGAGVADVAVIVNGDAAYVHADFARCERGEFFFLTGQGVIQAQAHGHKIPL